MFQRHFKVLLNKNSTLLTKKSNFWILKSGKSVGFIESIYEKGVMARTDYVLFRETSSVYSNGTSYKISVEDLPYQYKNQLTSVLTRKNPVYIEYRNELIGSFLKGNVINPYYATQIKPLAYDVHHIKQLSYHL